MPNQFDPKTCKELGTKFIAKKGIEGIKFSLLVLGGDGIGYTYTNREWIEIIFFPDETASEIIVELSSVTKI